MVGLDAHESLLKEKLIPTAQLLREPAWVVFQLGPLMAIVQFRHLLASEYVLMAVHP